MKIPACVGTHFYCATMTSLKLPYLKSNFPKNFTLDKSFKSKGVFFVMVIKTLVYGHISLAKTEHIRKDLQEIKVLTKPGYFCQLSFCGFGFH